MEIPPLNSWNSSLGRNSSPVGNHWATRFLKPPSPSKQQSVCFTRFVISVATGIQNVLHSFCIPSPDATGKAMTRPGRRLKQSLSRAFSISQNSECTCIPALASGDSKGGELVGPCPPVFCWTPLGAPQFFAWFYVHVRLKYRLQQITFSQQNFDRSPLACIQYFPNSW